MQNQKRFSANSANSLYLKLIEEISTSPEFIIRPRNLECKERLNVTMELTNPRDCLITFKDRKLNYAFAAIEKLEYLSGHTSPDKLIFYNSNFAKWINDLNYFDGSYSDRLKYWYRHIYNLLKKDPDTRQAVMTIYGIQDRHKSADICCTISHQYFIRNNKLYLTAYMRSQDLLWGFPYDINGFCFLQESMAALLNVGLGSFVLHVGSLHIYTEREEQLTKLVTSSEKKDIKNPFFDGPIKFDELYNNLNLFWFLEEKMRLNQLSTKKIHEFKEELIFPLQQYFDLIWQYKLKKDVKQTNT